MLIHYGCDISSLNIYKILFWGFGVRKIVFSVNIDFDAAGILWHMKFEIKDMKKTCMIKSIKG